MRCLVMAHRALHDRLGEFSVDIKAGSKERNLGPVSLASRKPDNCSSCRNLCAIFQSDSRVITVTVTLETDLSMGHQKGTSSPSNIESTSG